MLEMLRAHGLEAGPTQRPLTAGAIGGVLADLPALALLFFSKAWSISRWRSAHP